MIFVSATRITESGVFSYVVQASGNPPLVTYREEVVTSELQRLGVLDAGRLLLHVRDWGSVEIDDEQEGITARAAQGRD